MGADLYIESIRSKMRRQYADKFHAAVQKRDGIADRNCALWQKAHADVSKYYDLLYSKGYFRDSYNISNVLNTLGLSWWADVVPLLDRERHLKSRKLKGFRKLVVQATQTLPTKEKMEASGIRFAQTGENSLADWHEYYVSKRQELIAFLDQAIKLKTSIRCSL